MFSYIPANQVHGAPLIVVLHGCKQKAASFASDAGWFALSDRYGLRGDCVASLGFSTGERQIPLVVSLRIGRVRRFGPGT